MTRSLFSSALLLAAALAVAPSVAQAADVKATITNVKFHISHPAKEYDARLLPGGATAVAYFDGSDISATGVDVTIRVDKFNSDNTRRDSHMMEVLEGLIFPTLSWSVKGVTGASGPIEPGKTYDVKAKGPLKLHGETSELEIPVRIKVAENGLVEIHSEFSISLDAFQIERPTLVFVPIEDTVPVTVDMVFPAGPGLFAKAAAVAAPGGGDATQAGTDGEGEVGAGTGEAGQEPPAGTEAPAEGAASDEATGGSTP